MIGVTGHRDLVAAEEPRIEAAVEGFFADLQARFPGLPLMITTPLAEGADRLVARVAQRMGLRINILLPMPLEMYRRELGSASGAALQEMLDRGEVIELPLLRAPGPDGRLGAADADLQFELLGVYLASHSHILLALWDGVESAAPGGTAQVLQFHQHNVVHLISGVEPRSAIDFSEDESDLAYHIVCSRACNGTTRAGITAGSGSWLTRDDLHPRVQELPERYASVFHRQDQLNRDLAPLGVEPEQPPGAGEEAAADRDIAALFEAVDALAVRFQRRALFSLRGMYLLAALAGISFIAYADFPGEDGVIWFYLLLLTLTFAVFLMERRGRWYRRYLDYRGLAEGLRVQYHWARAGVQVENPAEFPHDKFMKREELELGWIRNVMRFAGRRADAAPSRDAHLECTIDEWVGDGERGETGYYRHRVELLLRHHRLTSRFSLAAFLTGVLAAVTLALLQSRLTESGVNLLISLMVGLPYLAAVRSSYAQRISEWELIAQYSRMHRIFSNAHRLLAATAGTPARQAILLALGQEAMQEVGQWILRQRERPATRDQLFSSG